VFETKQLKIFKTIVEVGSFTKAGEALGLSQPSISQHIRALEENAGVPLLVRVGKSARPTPAGDVLLHCAEQVLDRVAHAERLLVEHARGRTGFVRIGTPEVPCNYVLPGVLIELKRRLPKIDVRIVSGHTAATLERVGAGELDLALLPLPADTDRLRVVEAGRDELVAAVPPQHPWAVMPWVAAREFDRQPLILYDRASQITDLTLAFLLDEGIFPRIAVEIDHIEGLKELVRGGLGVAVVPRWALKRELADGALAAVRLGPTGVTRAWGLVYHEHHPLPAAVRELVALLAETLPPRFGAAAATT
jgi:DNA-binding transcriptional LysR family regulator